MKNYALLILCVLFLSGCASFEPLSIEYLKPAEISFPNELKRVAVINNTLRDSRSIVEGNWTDKPDLDTKLSFRETKYYIGNAYKTVESLSKAIANENYFDEVVLCDSIERADSLISDTESQNLTLKEVADLTNQLDVDFLISLEDIRLRTVKEINYEPAFEIFYGTIDVKTMPIIRIYFPGRSGISFMGNDSIYWDQVGESIYQVKSAFVSEKEMIEQASDYAGAILVKKLIPHWENADRMYYNGGSVNMRDAAVFAKEGEWDKAIELWQKVFNAKKNKLQMFAAHNLAVGYEMKDNLQKAYEFEQNALQIASQLAKGKVATSPYYVFLSYYLKQLEERAKSEALLNIQTKRLKDE